VIAPSYWRGTTSRLSSLDDFVIRYLSPFFFFDASHYHWDEMKFCVSLFSVLLSAFHDPNDHDCFENLFIGSGGENWVDAQKRKQMKRITIIIISEEKGNASIHELNQGRSTDKKLGLEGI